jgi:hypothetical protein
MLNRFFSGFSCISWRKISPLVLRYDLNVLPPFTYNIPKMLLFAALGHTFFILEKL